MNDQLNEYFTEKANSVLNDIKTLVNVIYAEDEDLPLLINDVKTKLSKTIIQSRLEGNKPPSLNQFFIETLLQDRISCRDIDNYVMHYSKEDSNTIEYDVFIKPRVALTKISTTIRIKKDVEEKR